MAYSCHRLLQPTKQPSCWVNYGRSTPAVLSCYLQSRLSCSRETARHQTASRRDSSRVPYESAKYDEDLRCIFLSKCQQRDYNSQCPFVCWRTWVELCLPASVGDGFKLSIHSENRPKQHKLFSLRCHPWHSSTGYVFYPNITRHLKPGYWWKSQFWAAPYANRPCHCLKCSSELWPFEAFPICVACYVTRSARLAKNHPRMWPGVSVQVTKERSFHYIWASHWRHRSHTQDTTSHKQVWELVSS